MCEKLPELIEIDTYSFRHTTLWWKRPWTKEINWPTEGLQVCHEAEKLLIKTQEQANANLLSSDYGIWVRYNDALRKIVSNYYKAETHATYEQRLEALCRVWFPERFD